MENGTIAKDQLILNGDPRYIFKKGHLLGAYANEFGECDAENVATFDHSSGIVTYHVDTEQFYRTEVCNTTCTPGMGYDPAADHGHFNAYVDIETLVVAAAVCVRAEFSMIQSF